MAQRSFMAGRVQYQAGQFNQIVSVDRTHFNFETVNSVQTGLEFNGSSDHTVERITAQTEYALSPSVALFGQFGAYRTTYNVLLPGNVPNYDSTSVRAVAGFSLDLLGLLRGQVTAGFAHRSYRDPAYHTPTGLVIATKLDWFLDANDNLSLVAKQEFDDGAVLSSTPTRYTMLALVFERGLRENVLAGFQANSYRQTSLGQATSPARFTDLGTSFYVKYMMNHHVSTKLELGVENNALGQGTVVDANFQPNTEFRTLFTITLRP